MNTKPEEIDSTRPPSVRDIAARFQGSTDPRKFTENLRKAPVQSYMRRFQSESDRCRKGSDRSVKYNEARCVLSENYGEQQGQDHGSESFQNQGQNYGTSHPRYESSQSPIHIQPPQLTNTQPPASQLSTNVSYESFNKLASGLTKSRSVPRSNFGFMNAHSQINLPPALAPKPVHTKQVHIKPPVATVHPMKLVTSQKTHQIPPKISPKPVSPVKSCDNIFKPVSPVPPSKFPESPPAVHTPLRTIQIVRETHREGRIGFLLYIFTNQFVFTRIFTFNASKTKTGRIHGRISRKFGIRLKTNIADQTPRKIGSKNDCQKNIFVAGRR